MYAISKWTSNVSMFQYYAETHLYFAAEQIRFGRIAQCLGIINVL